MKQLNGILALLLFLSITISYTQAVLKTNPSSSSPETPPLVSLIIPTFERQLFLTKALELVDKQDYPNLEVIIVDDSHGQSAQHFQTKVPVRYIYVPKRLSIGEKRNVALQVAKGEIIAHWDDDDYFRPYRISAQVAPILAGETDMTVLEHHYYFMSTERQFYSVKRLRSWGPHFATLTYKRELWDSGIRYTDTSLAEDYGFAEAGLHAGFKIRILDNMDGKHIYIRHTNTWDLSYDNAQVAKVPRPDFFSTEDEDFYWRTAQLYASAAGSDNKLKPINHFTSHTIRWDRPELQPRNAGSPGYVPNYPQYPKNYGPPAYDVDHGSIVSWPVAVVIVLGMVIGVAAVFYCQWRGRRVSYLGHTQLEEVGSSSHKGYGSV